MAEQPTPQELTPMTLQEACELQKKQANGYVPSLEELARVMAFLREDRITKPPTREKKKKAEVVAMTSDQLKALF